MLSPCQTMFLGNVIIKKVNGITTIVLQHMPSIINTREGDVAAGVVELSARRVHTIDLQPAISCLTAAAAAVTLLQSLPSQSSSSPRVSWSAVSSFQLLSSSGLL